MRVLTFNRTDSVHAAVRGVVAAMSMTGMRALSTKAGIVKETPPEMIADQEVPHLVDRLPDPAADSLLVLAHWGYGAAGGAFFGALPPPIRQSRWMGPAYGLALWAAFEVILEPVFGIRLRRKRPPPERAALAADHLLYGLVLNELRSRPSK
ncbi:hypothetical protein [Hoyosella altamirensis]|uniref:DUF1440 domain-containing protein n=1 Tax=Hoyosella altamirensis TaxID=616997 RepID=A0A839RL37_9ACTN|nr:hypothetical protein [Hoyosella altamirensis]MBB3036701.1 hypothetical protein [Hoyosella altamirensis]